MVFRTESWGARSWAALALGLALVLGGCSGGDAEDPADEQAEPAQDEGQDDQSEPTEPTDEQDEADAEQDEQTEAEGSGDCSVDAGTVTEIVEAGIDIALEDVNEIANDGVSCIYEGDTEDVAIIVAVSVGTWDGTDERVDGVVSQTAEYFGEPVATPDLGDQAFLFDDDFGGTSLVVFEGDMQYSTGLSGAGWTGTPLESLDQRQSIVADLYRQATG